MSDPFAALNLFVNIRVIRGSTPFDQGAWTDE